MEEDSREHTQGGEGQQASAIAGNGKLKHCCFVMSIQVKQELAVIAVPLADALLVDNSGDIENFDPLLTSWFIHD